MGAIFSPSHANIYMAWRESKFVFQHNNPFFYSLIWYVFYINYIPMIMVSDVAAIPDLKHYFNNNCFNLKFTHESDSTTIPFLDLLLKGDTENKQIVSNTFRKESAGNTILSARYWHPQHTIKAIPMGEIVRSKRNCSLESEHKMEIDRIYERL